MTSAEVGKQTACFSDRLHRAIFVLGGTKESELMLIRMAEPNRTKFRAEPLEKLEAETGERL
jgi:hypothetical protein